MLVVGGTGGGAGSLTSAEIWDPTTDTFSPTGSRAAERRHHRATVLPDGRVLVVGGAGDDYRTLASAEVWDAVTGTFSPTGSLAQERVDHTATALPDGRVLVVGGTIEYRTIDYGPLASAEVWEPGDR